MPIGASKHGAKQHIFNTGRLVTNSIARVPNRRLFRSVARYRFRVVTNVGCRTGDIRELPEMSGVHHFKRHTVVDGLRQLPPIQNCHEDIGMKAEGRYSDWKKTIVFASTAPAQPYKRFLWVVRRAPAVDRLMRFRSALATVRRADPAATDLSRADGQRRGFRLETGDPLLVCTHGLPPGGAERRCLGLFNPVSESAVPKLPEGAFEAPRPYVVRPRPVTRDRANAEARMET